MEEYVAGKLIGYIPMSYNFDYLKEIDQKEKL